MSDSTDLDHLLRQGLNGIPAPAPSRDFAARVQAELAQSPPWWIGVWPVLRPAIAAAACSLGATLALLAVYRPDTRIAAAPSIGAPPQDITVALNRALDRGAMLRASFASLPALETAAPAAVHVPRGRRSAPPADHAALYLRHTA